MRQVAPDIAIRSEIGFEEDLMRHLVEGTLDIGLMYTPTHNPELVVEHLFNESLVLVSSREHDTGPGEDYIYVEWGPGFYAQHAKHYPDLERPAQVVNIGWLGVQLILENGGSCFLPARMAQPFIEASSLFRVKESPEFIHPAYLVYPRESDVADIEQALQQLRDLV
jgi:DNA-binding transcriptional LysR family regulator